MLVGIYRTYRCHICEYLTYGIYTALPGGATPVPILIDTISKFGVNWVIIADFRTITRNLTNERMCVMLGGIA